LSKGSFKKSLIDVIECLVEYKLSDASISLISYYYNNSPLKTVREKAEYTIKRYLEEHVDTQLSKHSKKLKEYIEIMLIEADKWEAEIKEALELKNKRKKR